MASCFCDNRYESCLVSDVAGVTDAHMQAVVGTVGSGDRRNYCEYGYVESHPGNPDKTKFQSIELGPQWVGKTADGTVTLIDEVQIVGSSYKAIANQEPLFVNGEDPFTTNRWSFWDLLWGNSSNFYARDWLGNKVKASGFNISSYISGFTSQYLTVDGGFSADKVLVDGYIYVGRTGICIEGTGNGIVGNEVPKISGGLDDLSTGAKSYNDNEVKRCLSYYKDPLGSTSSTTTEPTGCTTTCDSWGIGGFCLGGETTTCTGSKDVIIETPYSGYGQQSCRDFNSNVETRMNFFQMMMSLFLGPFISVETNYKNLECSVQKMRHFSWKLWGGWG
jgi:hypothetical protein